MTRKTIKSPFGIKAFLAIGAIVCATVVAQTESIENAANSRIVISKATAVYDTNTKGGIRTLPKTIESIAWTPDGKNLLVDIQGVNQYYSIALMNLNGDKATVKLLTNSRDTANTRLNNSNPSFYKDGKHYVFIGQDLDSKEYKRSLPGIGLFSNICVANVNSPNFWTLTNYISSYKSAKGAVMPSFSKDGTMLCWTVCASEAEDRNFWGRRSIATAKFSFNKGVPAISGIKTYSPSQNKLPFYETYGFSPDGKSLLFASNLDEKQEWFAMDICLLNLESGEAKKLTNTPSNWNRYAAFSPNGKKIIYSSSEGYSVPFLGFNGEQWKNEMFSELWIMNSTGGERRKLSGFNELGNPQFVKTKAFIGAVAWNPTDPNKIAFILNVRNNAYSNSSSVMVAELANTLTANLPKK